ncbi:hypothetical protein M422DRAFT_76765 [Sphaerobolus stellatus SS14]|uniref:Uncharacterized protein n=1 Tax=Sphaerobolus stellatus (strain SS14) TaxID=990650 RepID=A0A0C9UKE5_SPHS4|nr:hypothetical protein M422DRAFT_76765 [Sphaerobolus stellatus SS14]
MNGTPGPSTNNASLVLSKPAYGSGDPDDGYTLVFVNIAEFQAWRAREEEEKVVEFVKGDTHGSKAVPPRFKDHTKLVCARHTRSGRKKYIKKYPERQRKLPSRKIEGEGCPASISYKTFHHTEEIRACYNDKHSHEIGEPNLLFTRRGRKAAQEKGKLKTLQAALSGTTASTSDSNSLAATPISSSGTPGPSSLDGTVSTSLHSSNGATPTTMHSADNGLSHHHHHQQQQNSIAGPSTVGHDPSLSPLNTHHPHPDLTHHTQAAHDHTHVHPHVHNHSHNHTSMSSAISLISPLTPTPPIHQPPDSSQARWDRMAILFGSIRQHARTFEYPAPSVAALESVLIRLYLESPMDPSGLSGTVMNGMGQSGHGT